MSVVLTGTNVVVFGAALTWGTAAANAAHMLLVRIPADRVDSMQRHLRGEEPIKPPMAVDAYMLLDGAQTALAAQFRNGEVPGLMRRLIAEATPQSIAAAARSRFGSQAEFAAQFGDRLRGLVQSTPELAAMVGDSDGVAQANWGGLSAEKDVRQMGAGGGGLRPESHGPGVRAGRYQRAAEQRAIRLTGFTEEQQRRLRAYAEIVALALLGSVSDVELSDRILAVYAEHWADLSRGGFLSLDAIGSIHAELVREGILDGSDTVWDAIVGRII